MSPPPDTATPSALRWSRWAPAALGLVLLAVYAPVVGFQFLELDDLSYVSRNPHLGDGLSLGTLRWALTSTYFGWWHPVTWISHLLDVSLFGYSPGGHHVTSAVLHALNAALAVVLLRRLGLGGLRAALIAALVMLHPTRVESVAWISERKDVLAATFFLLTLLAWGWYRERPGAGRYAAVLVCFVAGLASKTMLVTVPVLLLLLEAWRARGARVAWRRLALETAPLFALALAAGLGIIATQRHLGAMQPLEVLPLWARLQTVPLAYTTYLGLTFWPLELSAYYPRYVPQVWQWVGSLLLLAGLSGALWVGRRRWPHLLFGWAWFLVMLAPVVGVVQVGGQLVADRYLYLPHLGLVAGLVLSLPSSWLQARRVVALGASVALVLFMTALSVFQVQHWRDSETLFRHGLEVDPHCAFMQTSLGLLLSKDGRLQESLPYLQEAAPSFPFAQAMLGRSTVSLGRPREGLTLLADAARRDPRDERIVVLFSGAFTQAGVEAARAGHYARAIHLLEQALGVDAKNSDARRLLDLAREDLARQPAADGGAGP